MKMLLMNLVLGASVVADRWSTPQKIERIWGDGILDGTPWETMSYSWDDVLLEELALYSPTLGRAALVGDQPPVCELLEQMVTARVWLACCNGPVSEDLELDRVVAQLNERFPGIGLDVGDIYNTGRESVLGLYGDFEFERVSGSPAKELKRLMAVTSLYQDARDRSQMFGEGSPEDGPDLATALIASIQSDLNAAYVYREFEFAHELFLTGICLAQVARGRSVLLTPAIASCFLDVVENHQNDDVAKVLLETANAGIGSERLKRLSAKSANAQHLIVLKPKVSSIGFNSWLPPSSRAGRGLENQSALGGF